MEAISICPLRVASLRWRPSRASFALTVIVKATFRVGPVACPLAEEQEDPNEHENHWDDDPGRSLYSPGDLLPFKPRPEVMLVGYAFAPRGETVARLAARLVVGSVDKTVVVHGERVLGQDGALRPGPRFKMMPLRYERAAGGPATANPVGVQRTPDPFGAVYLPNLEPQGASPTRPDDRIEPIGFGPIAAGWPARHERLGRSAGSWSLGLLRTEPLPEPFDPLYFMSAPADQHLDELRPGQRIVLENLNPDHPRLVTSLPGVQPRAYLELPRAASSEVALRCDTLWIDTARSIGTLVWRGIVRLEEGPDQEGRVVVTMEEPRQETPASPRVDVAAPEVRVEAAPGRAHHHRATQPMAVWSEPLPAKRWPGWLPRETEGDPAQPAPAAPSVVPPPPSAEEARTLDQDLRAQIQARIGGALPAAPAWLPPTRVPSAPEAPLRPPLAATLTADAPRFQSTPPPPVIPAPVIPALAAPSFARDAGTPGSSGPSPVAPPMVSSTASSTAPPAVRLRSPPSKPPDVVRDAASRGAASASDAAAAASKEPASTPDARAVAPPPPREPAREHVDLIWFDAAEMPRIRADRALFDPQPERVGPTWIKGEREVSRHDQEAKDRRDLLAILTRINQRDEPGLTEAARAAYKDDGVFAAPLALVGGELVVTFDELEALRATITAVQPFLGADKKLREAVTGATDILKTEWTVTGDVAEGLTRRVEEAFSQGQRAVAPGYLDASVERILLEGRHYKRKTLLGERRIRAVFNLPGAGAPVPTYLPDALAARLPLFRRFKAKAVVTLRPQEDQYEAHADALIVLALGRVLSRAT